MSGSLNKVILIGNLGKSPEIKSTQDGKRIATFSLATSTSWVDKNTKQKKEKTEWHSVVVFSDSLCKIIDKYVSKGSKLYIEGELNTKKWTDKTGNERYTTQVVLQGFSAKLVMLSSNKSSNEAGELNYKQESPALDEYVSDDIPF